jgi:hypothetical protein
MFLRRVTYPRTAISCLRAFSASASSTVQFWFFLLNASVTEAKTTTSFAPLWIAFSRPFALGANTGNLIWRCWAKGKICFMTVAPSASWGTHLGETNEVASMLRSPAEASPWMSSTFIGVAIDCFMFCSPSLGPTSTIRTADASSREADVTKARYWNSSGNRKPERKSLVRSLVGLVQRLVVTKAEPRWNMPVRILRSFVVKSHRPGWQREGQWPQQERMKQWRRPCSYA